jgi:hypothetical protein
MLLRTSSAGRTMVHVWLCFVCRFVCLCCQRGFSRCRRYTVAEFEKAADDFAKKRFGCAGTLPDRLVEVRSCLACRSVAWIHSMVVTIMFDWHARCLSYTPCICRPSIGAHAPSGTAPSSSMAMMWRAPLSAYVIRLGPRAGTCRCALGSRAPAALSGAHACMHHKQHLHVCIHALDEQRQTACLHHHRCCRGMGRACSACWTWTYPA